jgi:hypothetical protein
VRDPTPLPPRVLQVIGLLLLVGFAVFWAITGKESSLLVGASFSLVLAAQYERAKRILQKVSGPPKPWSAELPPKEDEDVK